MKCLVAGGAGFIGSNLCERLLKDGYEVLCVDNLITGAKENIKHLLSNPKFTFINHDITQPIPNSNLHPLSIFHLASPASPNRKSKRSYINYPIETLLANSLGTQMLLMLAKKEDSRFLYASSSEVYGDPAVSVQNESYFGNVNPVGMRSVYDEGKRFGEALTMAYVRKHALNARIVRIFNTYGPKMQTDDGRVVSNFITQALTNSPITVYGDGSQTRSLCYIDDMIEAIVSAMFSDETEGQVINLGNPDERSIKELATMVKELTRTDSEIVFEDLPEDDPKKRKPDIKKAQKLLHWNPKVELEEGLRKTIEYFKRL